MERNPSCSSRNLKISLFKINERGRKRSVSNLLDSKSKTRFSKIIREKRDTFVKKKKKKIASDYLLGKR